VIAWRDSGLLRMVFEAFFGAVFVAMI